MLRVLVGEWLMNLMSGLMAAWWRIKFLVPLLLERVVLRIAASYLGKLEMGPLG